MSSPAARQGQPTNGPPAPTALPLDAATGSPAAPTEPRAAPTQPVPVPAASRAKPGPSPQLTQHSGSLQGPIEYIVVEPANAPPDAPLVIALHGRGDKPENFARLVYELGLNARVIVGRGPVPRGGFGGRQWWDMQAKPATAAAKDPVDEAVEQVATLVDQLAKTYPKSSKPLIFGFSQGGMLALQALARRPGLFDGVVALSAFLPSTQGNAKPADDQRVPVMLTAGKRDRVNTPDQTHKAAEALRQLGYAPELVRFDGGHSVPKPIMKRLRAFLDAHARAEPQTK